MPDVIVVGAGPVGLMLACQLVTEGLTVQVLEQRTEPSGRSRAIGIHPPSLRALHRIGVADDVLRRAVRIRSGEVRCDDRALGSMSFTAAAPEYPFVVALPQNETEQLLRHRFAQLCPEGLSLGAAVTGVRDRGDHVEVTAGAGAGADGDDAPRTLSAGYVVAADGARSVVRTAAGIGWRRIGTDASYLMGDFVDSADPADPAGPDRAAMLYFERGGVVESFPLPGDRRRWVALTDRLSEQATSADLADLIFWRTGVRLADPLGPASAFSVQQNLAARMSQGRIALVGDAAHQISPIGGQGMNLGWLDGVALAPALRRAVRQPGQALAALTEFDRHRRRSARMAVRQAGFNMSMGQPARGLRLAARNTLVRSLARPPLNDVLARAFTMRWL